MGPVDDATASVDQAVSEVDLGPLGGDREAKVVLPADWSPDKTYPVVVLLHGITANSTVQNAYLRTSILVDELQYVLVLPEGTRNSNDDQFWNATTNCCDFEGSGVDDAAYLIELARDAVARYGGDSQRLYFFGHSNGGYMSYRLACDYSDEIAGIASLAGSSWVDPANCGNPGPVTVLQVHGTDDETVLYDGRLFEGEIVQPGAEEVIARWVERSGCDAEPGFVGSVDFDSAAPAEETTKDRWANCAGGTAVQLWRMNGSSHIPSVGEPFSRAVLQFLFEHPRQ
jgi:polyhydroxybutyrate depolymerase